MKKNFGFVGTIVIFSLLTISRSHALLIDEATFEHYGGDPSNITESIKTHNDTLRKFSYETPWLAVGTLDKCDATWLGDEDGWSYFLTGATCVDTTQTESPYNGCFTAWDGTEIASGRGTAYVPPQRVKIPTGLGGSSTAIAIVKLPTKRAIVDQTGQPIERPILNDDFEEIKRDIIMVGYSPWGVGEKESNEYLPATGDRRLYGRSRIDSTIELDTAVVALYDPVGPSAFWSRTKTTGGIPWWQVRGRAPVIVAIYAAYNGTRVYATRVSKYVEWIKSVYSDARFLSAEKPHGCIVALNTNMRYCLPVGGRVNKLPVEFYGQEIYVDAGSDTTVTLSVADDESCSTCIPQADFKGTVLNNELKHVNTKGMTSRAADFSKPRSMSVSTNTDTISCITSLTNLVQYCRSSEQPRTYQLPNWIYGHEVQVNAAPGNAVRLSDWVNLSYNRIADFTGFVQNWELKNVKAKNGEDLDFSRPHSMATFKK